MQEDTERPLKGVFGSSVRQLAGSFVKFADTKFRGHGPSKTIARDRQRSLWLDPIFQEMRYLVKEPSPDRFELSNSRAGIRRINMWLIKITIAQIYNVVCPISVGRLIVASLISGVHGKDKIRSEVPQQCFSDGIYNNNASLEQKTSSSSDIF
ncbi:hypothetical protein AK812_SmicGene14973 [Symbiodinium microadriaticum]|uniref:Uncharacterized protein n=1 Tax=Symbiodinium microadriaticum TaxID=2951 RepID=A0A1Q9E499_SYMMI|nr:hypothetical protein AK812_SmicGene14973 [Symbiodinium microadriaticum]